MKTTTKAIIWLSGLLISCCLTGLFYVIGGAGATSVPHASLKIVVPPESTLQKTFYMAETVILSQGYRKQPYDPQQITQDYAKGDFQVSYDPTDAAQVSLKVVYLYFDEFNQKDDLFSKTGIAEYATLSKALRSVGLRLLPEDQADREQARFVATPEMYNNRWAPQLPWDRFERWMLILFGVLFYGFLIIWPAFWILLRLLRSSTLPIWLRRGLFIAASAILLPPGFFLPTPFGPVILVPLPLALPFALLAPPLLYPLAFSVVCTMILASVVSLRIRGRYLSTAL